MAEGTAKKGTWKGREPWSAMILAINRRNWLTPELGGTFAPGNQYKYVTAGSQVQNYSLPGPTDNWTPLAWKTEEHKVI